jgi:hypothetical protein
MLGALALAAGVAVRAGQGMAAGEEPAPQPVELERLLKLPSHLDYEVEKRGGATRGEWRARFRTTREELAASKAALEKAQTALEEAAGGGSSWQLAPPGAQAASSDATLHYALREEVRRQRDEVARGEKKLRALEVEANLAGVPQDWRE